MARPEESASGSQAAAHSASPSKPSVASVSPLKQSSDSIRSPVDANSASAAAAFESAATPATTVAATPSNTPVTLSCVQACSALRAILTEMQKSEIDAKLQEAKESAAGQLEQIMTNVVPLLFEIQGHVMSRFGITPDDDGFAHFSQQLSQYEANPDFKVLSDDMKSRFKALTAVESKASNDSDDSQEELQGVAPPEED